jgi:hypothetical protein
MSSYSKQDYEWYKARGLCPRCRINKAADGMVTCPNCILESAMRDIGYGTARKTVNAKALRERYKLQGLCVRCGKRPAKPGILSCEQCSKKYNAKNRIWQREHYVHKIRPDGICRFCDNPVVPGKKLCAIHMVSENAKLEKARAAVDKENHPWRR